MKVKVIDGTEYNKAFIAEMRAEVIRLRNEALSQSDMGWSVKLSHVIAMLGMLEDEVEA